MTMTTSYTMPSVLMMLCVALLLSACGGQSGEMSKDRAAGLAENEFQDCPECPVMVTLPPGRFLMGSADGEEEAAANPIRPEPTIRAEKPQVEVEIAYPLAMGKYPVTFE